MSKDGQREFVECVCVASSVGVATNATMVMGAPALCMAWLE